MSGITDLQFPAMWERVRQSLFVIPGVCIVVGIGLAELTVRLDRAGAGSWLPDSYETTSEDARAVLSAIATGTITMVTLVLTLTLVAIQLASGQLSPRTIINFLGDRFQQATVGVVIGTATLSLFALRALGAVSSSSVRPPDLTVLAAVIAAVASLMMLVISVDRTARRLAVGNLLHDVAEETAQLVEERYGRSEPSAVAEQPGRLLPGSPGPDAEDVTRVRSKRSGWVQYIDEEALLERLPEGAGVEILTPVGSFVFEEMEVVRIHTADVEDATSAAVGQAIIVGDGRTMQQDVSFGLTRLTDIGLRALSPGTNDPNTAREVVLRVAQVVLRLQEVVLDASTVEIDGRTVVRYGAPTHDLFARDAFDQLRRGAAEDVATLLTMQRALRRVIDETNDRSLPGGTSELERQEELVLAQLRDLDQDLDDRRSSSLR
ncbi:MAG: DUF2254 domain-containing protein [Acidimicrobiales bacterium]|nr:DUF2254 domain-containing protein [Acidimicrobiales bacterium]